MKIFFALCSLMILTSAHAAETSAEVQKIPVPTPFRDCKKDADCTVTTQFCGCCDEIAMSKKFVKKYAALQRYCKEPPPPCKCFPSERKAKCVKKLCELSAKA